MTKPKENMPENIKRITLQMDDNLHRSIKMEAIRLGVKTYELINKLLILGSTEWTKGRKDTQINVKSNELKNAREMAKIIK